MVAQRRWFGTRSSPLSWVLGAALMVWTTPAAAQVVCIPLEGVEPPEGAVAGVQTRFCGDDSSDFGTACSLRELNTRSPDACIRIGDVVFNSFQYFEVGSPLDPVADLSQIRVVPTGVGTQTPGLRIEAYGEWSTRQGFGGQGELHFAVGPPFELTDAPRPIAATDYRLAISYGPRTNEFGDYTGGWVTGQVEVGGAGPRTYAVPAEVDPSAGPPQGRVELSPPVTSVSWAIAFNAYGEEVDAFASVDAIEASVLLAGAPAPSENASPMIQNPTFENGLSGWMLSGPGSASVAPTESGRPAVEITTEGAPTTLSQTIDTPLKSFIISFDYRFLTPTGSLDVLINDARIGAVAAAPTLSPVFTHEDILANDVRLMGLSGATLAFRVNPGSMTRVLTTNIHSPVFHVELKGEAETTATVFGDEAAEFVGRTETGELAATTELDGGSTASASARAVIIPFFVPPGLELAAAVRAEKPTGLPQRSAFRAAAKAKVSGVFTTMGCGDPDPGRPLQAPIPIDYKLSLSGTVEVAGNRCNPCVTVTFESNLRQNRANCPAFTAMEDGGLVGGSTPKCPFFDGRIAIGSGTPPTGGGNLGASDVTELTDGGAIRVYSVTKELSCGREWSDGGPLDPDGGACLYIQCGDTIELSGILRLLALPEENDAMVADFSRTARAVIFTDAPGVVLVPVGQEADGGVPAGVDGGLDDGGMPTGTDAGAPAGDGSTAAPKVGGGCECGAATAGAPAPGIAGLLALALVAWRRRRYRDCGSNAV